MRDYQEEYCKKRSESLEKRVGDELYDAWLAGFEFGKRLGVKETVKHINENSEELGIKKKLKHAYFLTLIKFQDPRF